MFVNAFFFHMKYLINLQKFLQFLKVITQSSLSKKKKALRIQESFCNFTLRKTLRQLDLTNKGNWRALLVMLSLQLKALPR